MTVSSVLQNGKSLTFHQSANRLEIDLTSPAVKNEVENFAIYYSGIPSVGLIISKNKYGDRTFFGDNWPDRAHSGCLPSIIRMTKQRVIL